MDQKSNSTGPPAGSVRGALRLSTLDGALASVFGALTGGIFLTGFALRLGANELLVGLFAALPLVAAAAQLFGAYLIERVGRRRAICIRGAAASRLLWLAALALPLLAATPAGGLSPWLLLALAAASHVVGSLGGVAWLSWMADLVPIGLRGRYFGSRNLVAGVATAAATLAGGWYLDRFSPIGPPWGFATMFALAVVAGWGSVLYLRRIPEPPAAPPEPVRFLRLVREPFRDRNFWRLVRFSVLWNAAVHFAAPFFTVFMLEALRVSYTEVAALATLSTVAHLVTIRGWGRLADQFGNRPIMFVTAAACAPVPALWLAVTPENFWWLGPSVHLLGGAAWAGYGLTSSNLLLRLSPREHNAVYFSTFAALTGLGSAVAPVVAGATAVWLGRRAVAVGPFLLDWFGLVFAVSLAGRVATLLLLRKVVEPRQSTVRAVVRMLSTVRGFSTLVGFDEVIQFLLVTVGGRAGLGPARLTGLPGDRPGGYTEGSLRRGPRPGAQPEHTGALPRTTREPDRLPTNR
jgi:MFS family permease